MTEPTQDTLTRLRCIHSGYGADPRVWLRPIGRADSPNCGTGAGRPLEAREHLATVATMYPEISLKR
jgi:hypothetical protein